MIKREFNKQQRKNQEYACQLVETMPNVIFLFSLSQN